MATNPLALLPTADADRDRVEQTLLDVVRLDDDPYLTEISSHLIKAGGKRLRPLFAAASAAASMADGVSVSDDVIRGGVAVELVHIGSLYHDDVMDEASMRRQVVSVNARWGNLRAILSGDYLLAKASEIAAELGVEVAGLLASTIAELCQGQVAELQTMYDVERTPEQYFPSIAGKTASLYAAACRIGGIVSEQPRADIDALTEFGRLYGMAFQVVDDILDVIATDEQLGKPAGNDMIEGVYSLPVIFTLASSNGNALRALLTDGLDTADRHAAIELVRSGPGVAEAYAVAAGFVEQAKEVLAGVSTNAAATALAGAADHLLGSIPGSEAFSASPVPTA
ncbi:MAG: polyprenyl synthetase family protein [Acidimicrobiales bacterium]